MTERYDILVRRLRTAGLTITHEAADAIDGLLILLENEREISRRLQKAISDRERGR